MLKFNDFVNSILERKTDKEVTNTSDNDCIKELNINESANSDKYELLVAEEINKTSGFSAERPRVDVTYPDVLVINNKTGNKSWVEVKMNHTDNLGNVRVSYDGLKWSCSRKNREVSPLKDYIEDFLNKSEEVSKFIKDLEEYTGIKNVELPTVKGNPSKKTGLYSDKAVPKEDLQKFLSSRPTKQYIVSENGVDLGNLVTNHYLRGKAESAHYMQAGDDFYLIGKDNPLSLPNDIPLLSGIGPFKMRISIRSEYYEIQPEIKIEKMPNSKYSIKPGTKKINPFES
jgi:hypothetical protein